jgi:prevent-host-death family protein
MEAAVNAQSKLRPNVTTMTSREFNQHTGRAKAAADIGPVIITDRGEPAYVLMTNADYEQLSADRTPGKAKFVSILDALADPNYKPGDPDLMDFIPPREVDPLRDPFADE